MGFYSVSPLTPGGWADLLDDAGLPHALRRLPLTDRRRPAAREVEDDALPADAAGARLPAGDRTAADGERLGAGVAAGGAAGRAGREARQRAA